MKTIRIECVGAGVLPIDEMHDFQGELKSLSKDNYRKLKAEIVDTGFAFPIHIWTDPETKKHFIVGGHQRVKTLTQMRDKEMYVVPEIPVVYVWASDFFEAKRRVLQDISQYGHIERQGLYEFMIHADLDMDEMSSAFDFSEPPIDMEKFEVEFFDDPKPEPQAGDDEVPEIKIARVHRGQIWELGNHRLMCGDATSMDDVEQLMNGKRADMVFTDPPYGISYKSNMSDRFDMIANDDVFLDIAPVIYNVMAENTAAIIWTSQQVYPKWREQFSKYYKSTIIWYKGGGGMGDLKGDFAPNYEMALFCTKGRPEFFDGRPGAVWEIGKDAASKYVHPTQKPVELGEYGLNMLCKKSGIVLDLFGGSGSTLIACEKNDRRCYIMELDAWYCTVIIERWIQYTGNDAQRINEDGTKTPYSTISK